MTSLALCLIFRDEESYLKEALESALPLVDEAILVDSGSKDRSLKIAQEFRKKNEKVRVFERNWPDDFADQKNYALEKATADWILFLDADERVFETDHALIRRAIESRDIDAYSLPIRNYTENIFEMGYQPPQTDQIIPHGFYTTHLHRLFKNGPNIRYEGEIHERIEPSLERESRSTDDLEAIIHHLGPLKEKNLNLSHQRYKFYAPLAEKKVRQQPQDPQAHWELGVIYLKQRQLGAAELEFSRARQLGQSETIEKYYFLSLFHQEKWTVLAQEKAQFPSNDFFILIAKAQRDDSVITRLDVFQKDYSQAALMQFELALRHQKQDLIETYRSKVPRYFIENGSLDWIEGSVLRSQGRIREAVLCLKKARKKGCVAAFHELVVALTQNEQWAEVLKTYRELSRNEQGALSSDTFKVLALSAKTLGEDPQPYLQRALAPTIS